MKKLLILILLSAFTMMANAQIGTSYNLDGYWSEWRDCGLAYKVYGNYSGFVIYRFSDYHGYVRIVGAHPSNYEFKFQIDSYKTPDKKTIKQHKKKDLWYEYSGYVEYYVSEKYPTVRAMLKGRGFPFMDYSSGKDGNPRVKRTARARIRIQPYKKHPKVYNIWFDDVAVGIDLMNLQFNQ